MKNYIPKKIKLTYNSRTISAPLNEYIEKNKNNPKVRKKIINIIKENKIIEEIFNGALPSLYSFYYEGNYLSTEDIQNFVKDILNNRCLTYLFLQNNQISPIISAIMK